MTDRLAGYVYRKSHVINPQAGAGTNYPVCVRVIRGTGVDGTESYEDLTIGKVYVEDKCKSDFGDIRFTKTDGITELKYWMEKSTNELFQGVKYGSNPVLTGANQCYGSVLKVGSVYHYYYAYGNIPWHIGHSTSNDGITWTPDAANPVLSAGGAGTWDSYDVWCPMVWKEGNTWYMLYVGRKASVYYIAMGLATSTDGTIWTKDPANPVLTGGAGQWDENDIESFGLIKVDSTYYCFYDTLNHRTPRMMGVATSTDLHTWTKDPANPTFYSEDVAEYNGYFCAAVYKSGNYYYFIVTHRHDPITTFEIFRDTSPTFHVGTREFLGEIISKGTVGQWDAGGVDTPWVMHDDINMDLTGATPKIYYSGVDGAGAVLATGYFTVETPSPEYAVFWVKIEDSLESSSQTIYVYYGKADATTTSSGVDVFIFFDDFSVPIDWTNKWQSNNNGKYNVDAGRLKIAGDASNQPICTKNNYIDVCVSVQMRNSLLNKQSLFAFEQVAKGITSKDLLYISADQNKIQYYLNGNLTDTNVIINLESYYHHKYYIPASGNATLFLYDFLGAQVGTKTGTPAYRTIYPSLQALIANSINYADDFYVRKYISPEPTHGAWGSQEGNYILTITCATVSVTVKIDGVEYETPFADAFDPNVEVDLEFFETEPVHGAGTVDYWRRYYWNRWDDGETSKTRTITIDEPKSFAIILDEKYITPYQEDDLREDDASILITMPESHSVNSKLFQKWSEDSSTNRIKSVVLDDNETFTALFFSILTATITEILGGVDTYSYVTIVVPSHLGGLPSLVYIEENIPVILAKLNIFERYIVKRNVNSIEVTMENYLIKLKMVRINVSKLEKFMIDLYKDKSYILLSETEKKYLQDIQTIVLNKEISTLTFDFEEFIKKLEKHKKKSLAVRKIKSLED